MIFKQYMHLHVTYCQLIESNTPSQESIVFSGLAAQKFGLAILHPWQMTIIEATIKKRDSLVIQPTGAGKIPCYIIPPLYDGKTTIVIAPTISLMLDQVSNLENKNIPATFLGSGQKDDVYANICRGDYPLAYTTPES